MEKYNDNITIKCTANGSESLQDNEFYALMVKDAPAPVKETRHFFSQQRHWIGLECTDSRVYISKHFRQRHNRARGETLVVEVSNTFPCCVLKQN